VIARRAPLLLSIAAMGLWTTFARATDSANFVLKTTEDLYRVCSTASNDPLRVAAINFCEGYLLGVLNYHDAITDREHLKPLVCYPQTATRDQGVQAFIDWAASHQQDRKFMNDPPVVGAVRGLASKWPCK
jgi:Rap1a immunity proteins